MLLLQQSKLRDTLKASYQLNIGSFALDQSTIVCVRVYNSACWAEVTIGKDAASTTSK